MVFSSLTQIGFLIDARVVCELEYSITPPAVVEGMLWNQLSRNLFLVLSLIGFGHLQMSLSLITKFIPAAASFGKWRVNLVNEIHATMVECSPIIPQLAVHKVNQFFGCRPALDGMVKINCDAFVLQGVPVACGGISRDANGCFLYSSRTLGYCLLSMSLTIDVFSPTIDLGWFEELKRRRKVLILLILTMFLERLTKLQIVLQSLAFL